MTIPELESPVLLEAVPGRLHIALTDERATSLAADIVEDVVGRCALVTGGATLNVDGIDGRTAVDLLAELAWAGLVPIAFSLG